MEAAVLEQREVRAMGPQRGEHYSSSKHHLGFIMQLYKADFAAIRM